MKKKIFTTALAIALIVLSIAGTSLAYFTDVDDATTTFTTGSVAIDLTFESLADEKLFPGMTYSNSAVISNVGTEDAYVGAIITVTGTNLSGVLATEAGQDNVPAALKDVFGGLEKAGYIVKYATIANGYAIYVVREAALAGKTADATASADIFSAISIPAEWDREQMDAFVTATVTVKAYATQVVGFTEGAEKAILAAFATQGDWAGYPSTNP